MREKLSLKSFASIFLINGPILRARTRFVGQCFTAFLLQIAFYDTPFYPIASPLAGGSRSILDTMKLIL
jgi:hypothetical protein